MQEAVKSAMARAEPASSERAQCAVALERTAPDSIMLMPLGEVETRDSRPPWINDEPDAVVSQTTAEGRDLVIDFDHQTEFVSKTGQPAPAAGWIKGVSKRPDGIYARVEWTARAREQIEGGEYRFISPVFLFDPKTRRVTRFLSAALTNNPALTMKAIANKEGEMDELLKLISAALGLAEDADKDAVIARATALAKAAEDSGEPDARIVAVATALEIDAGAEADAFVRAIAARAAAPAEPDPSRFVSLDAFNEVSQKLGKLETDLVEEKATAAAEAAIQAGKLTPAQRDWAIAFAAKDPEAFAEFADKQPAVFKPGSEIPGGEPRKGGDGLTDEERATCSALGITAEDFIKTRDKEEAA